LPFFAHIILPFYETQQPSIAKRTILTNSNTKSDPIHHQPSRLYWQTSHRPEIHSRSTNILSKQPLRRSNGCCRNISSKKEAKKESHYHAAFLSYAVVIFMLDLFSKVHGEHKDLPTCITAQRVDGTT
jgi:hypothetical protein